MAAAAAASLCEQDLLCPQCSDIYCLPVLLHCGHNICRVCLHKFWELRGCRECPVCGAPSVQGRPPINLKLKVAADAFQQQRSLTEKSCVQEQSDPELCCLHKQKLQMFCHNDEELICLLCQASTQHKVHEVSAVEEAAPTKKTEISATLDSLRKKLRALNQTKQQWEETRSYIQVQASQNEETIKMEFEKLHHFLEEEESMRLKVLQQEAQVKSQVMSTKLETISQQIQNLSSTICDVETALAAKDLPFLQNYKQTKKRVKTNIPEPECLRQILIDSAKHLGCLKFTVWKKMGDMVRYAPVTLDPNTAQSNLHLSQELTCVVYSSKQPLPDNPERVSCRVSVLGSAGFTRGRHSWTVDLGRNRDWVVGVARESIRRKSPAFLSPEEGLWVLSLEGGETLRAHSATPTRLNRPPPQRLTVRVNCERGKVTFLDAADGSTLHHFTSRFTERIFPFLSPGLHRGEPLSICTLSATVTCTDAP